MDKHPTNVVGGGTIRLREWGGLRRDRDREIPRPTNSRGSGRIPENNRQPQARRRRARNMRRERSNRREPRAFGRSFAGAGHALQSNRILG